VHQHLLGKGREVEERGTHDYAKFIKPSELSRYCRESGLAVKELIGMSYNPITRIYSLGVDTDVNYLLRATRDG
jgi:2-polyprenyl-6-hydroxyphenyl methylase/3-demethylubiquinone-9 3-methyltransferase